MNTSRISHKPFHLLWPFGLAAALFAGPAGGAMNPNAAHLLQPARIIQTSLGQAPAASCIVPGGAIPASGCLPPPPRPASFVAASAKN